MGSQHIFCELEPSPSTSGGEEEGRRSSAPVYPVAPMIPTLVFMNQPLLSLLGYFVIEFVVFVESIG